LALPPVDINANASDAGSGVKEVRFYVQSWTGGAYGTPTLVGADTTSPYSAVWVFPPPGCPNTNPDARYRILARAEDNCGNVSPDAAVDVRFPDLICFRAAARSADATGAFVSELLVPDARGQVVVDGTQAVFPAGGTATFSLPVSPGRHRFEATLVDGAGRPGTWRFDLSTLGLRPGSLRVVAGEAAEAGSAAVVFRLRGKPGERVVFTFDVGGEP
jgi:hypothetical protein